MPVLSWERSLKSKETKFFKDKSLPEYAISYWKKRKLKKLYSIFRKRRKIGMQKKLFWKSQGLRGQVGVRTDYLIFSVNESLSIVWML